MRNHFQQDHCNRKTDSARSSVRRVRPVLRKSDLLILLLIPLIALILYAVPRLSRSGSGRVIADIRLDNKLLKSLDLSQTPAGQFTLEDLPGITFSVNPQGGICFLHSDCPDQLCVKRSWLTRPGDFAACLPRHVILSLRSESPDKALPSKPDGREPDIVLGPGGAHGGQ